MYVQVISLKKAPPKVLSYIFAVSFIVIVFALAAGFVNFIIHMLRWISSITSTFDAVVIVALITGGVSLVSVMISSIVAKRIEYKRNRQEYLAKKREIPYGQFVDMVYKIQSNVKTPDSYTDEQMISDISQFSRQITLWGSSKVVNKWVEFREKSLNPAMAKDNLFILEEIMNEMRADLGLKKAKKGRLLAFFINDVSELLKTQTKQNKS